MSANTSPTTTEKTPDLTTVVTASVDVSAATEATAPIVVGKAKAIAVATTVVTSTLDSLEKLRVAVRKLATASIDYGDTVADKVAASSRTFVERFDAAATTALASARKLALEAIERRSAEPATDIAAAA